MRQFIRHAISVEARIATAAGRGGAGVRSVYVDDMIEIDGPPRQRFFDPRVDLASVPLPCAPALHRTAAGNGCSLLPPRASWAELASGLARSSWLALVGQPSPMASWALGRIQPYRSAGWKAAMAAAAAAAEAAGEGTTFYAEERRDRSSRGAFEAETWVVHGLVPARSAREDLTRLVDVPPRDEPAQLFVLDGRVRVHEQPGSRSPWGTAADVSSGEELPLRVGVNFGIEVTSERALWCYRGVAIEVVHTASSFPGAAEQMSGAIGGTARAVGTAGGGGDAGVARGESKRVHKLEL